MGPAATSRIHSLYRGYRGKVLRRAQQLLRNEQAAEDATQDVFLRLLDSERVLQHPEPLAWLYRVTTNLCLNRLRDEKRRTALVARNPPKDRPAESDAELRAGVVEILRRVPSELQEIAIYYHAEGMTCDEIAARVGVSRRTIGNRLEEFQSMAAGACGNA